MLKIKKKSSKLDLFFSASTKKSSNYYQINIINYAKLFFSER